MTYAVATWTECGGEAKTTLGVHLAAGLAIRGRSVALLDLDPQATATYHLGHEPDGISGSAALLRGKVRDAFVDYVPPGNGIGKPFRLAPASPELYRLRGAANLSGKKLRKALEPIRSMYDYIYIDCPPSINMLTLNALTAADGVLIPIQCEYYALEGLSSLLETARQIRNSVNPGIGIEGLLRTMFDPRNRLANEVSAQLIKHFGNKVYDAVIPRNVRLAEAPSYGVPILIHDPRSRGSIAYMELAREILREEPAAVQVGAA